MGVLKSAVDDFAFGHCQDAADGETLESLALCNHSGTPFGTLRLHENGGFMMRTTGGWTVCIQDEAPSRVWIIEVASGQLLAVTEVCSNTNLQRVIRVGPEV